MANDQNMLRIDMSKEQTLSEGAAAYVARSEEDLTAMIAQAEACIEALASLAANPAVFEPERRICLDPQALPEAIPELFGTAREALRDIPLAYFQDQLAHILRMSRKARDIVRIRRDRPATQALLDVLYPMSAGRASLARLAGQTGQTGQTGQAGRKRSVLDGLFNRRKGGRLR